MEKNKLDAVCRALASGYGKPYSKMMDRSDWAVDRYDIRKMAYGLLTRFDVKSKPPRKGKC